MWANKRRRGGRGEIVTPRVPPATLHFHGACRGNPGIAGIGFVLRDCNGREIERYSRLLGSNFTNNVAEYTALIEGLQHALAIGLTDIVAYGDSELVCNHANTPFPAMDDTIIRYYNDLLELRRIFRRCSVQHVPREHNNDADGLANWGIDDNNRRTEEILRLCSTPQGATDYVLEKRREGFSQLCFILDTIERNLPLSYAAVQRWCRQLGNLTVINGINPVMAFFLVNL